MIETLLRSPTFVTFLVASFILAITPGPAVVNMSSAANLHADRGMNVLRDPRNDCVMVFDAFAT